MTPPFLHRRALLMYPVGEMCKTATNIQHPLTVQGPDACKHLETLPLPNRIDFRERLGLTDEELEQWDRISRRMFVPFHDGIISQFL